MTHSGPTEETPTTPGWVEDRIAALFAPLGPAGAGPAQDYATCLAGVRGAVETEAGFQGCRTLALAALAESGADLAALNLALEALEAEISADT